ncbi:MAG: hypothetical protein RI993_791, partial [Pseudomonadota bacterium]
IGMTGNPADIRCAPEYIVWFEIKNPLHADHRAQQITRRGVLHSFGLAGRTRGIQGKQGMFGADPHGVAFGRLILGQLVPLVVTRRIPRNRHPRNLHG